MLKDDIWPNPLQYFLAADMDENGLTDSNSDDDNDNVPVQNIEDDSVVIVGDDDSDDGNGHGFVNYAMFVLFIRVQNMRMCNIFFMQKKKIENKSLCVNLRVY